MRYFLALVFAFTFYSTYAQDPNAYFNSEAFWKNVQLDPHVSTVPGFSEKDTVIIVASNRNMHAGNIRFMDEVSDSGLVKYFFVYARGGKWHVRQTKDLEEAISFLHDKNKDWVIYTEGMGKIFTSDLDRGLRMAGTYNVNVLLLDYPSIRTDLGGFKNYKFAIHNARTAYKDLLPVIEQMKALKHADRLGTGHVSLFFHSMGNNVMSEIVLKDRLAAINNEKWIDNLVLNSACVKQKHHKEWLDQIHFAKYIYVDYNPTDRTLKGAHLASFKKQLGEKVRKPVSENATYINFSKIVGERHSNFAPLLAHPPVIPRVISQYSILLHGNELPVKNSAIYKPSGYRHIGWDMLPEQAN